MPKVLSSHTLPELRLAEMLRAWGCYDFLTPPISGMVLFDKEATRDLYAWASVVPDIKFKKQRVVIEVVGEFWHKQSEHKSRKTRMEKDERRKNLIMANGYKYLEYTDEAINAAYKYFSKKKFRDKALLEYAIGWYEQIRAEVSAALAEKKYVGIKGSVDFCLKVKFYIFFEV